MGGTGDVTLNGPIWNSSTLTKVGDNAVTLAGGDDNPGMAAIVHAGTLVLAKESSEYAHAIGGGGLTIDGGTVQVAGSGGQQIYYWGETTLDGGTLALQSGDAMASNVLALNGGTLDFGNLSSAGLGGLNGTQNLTLANSLGQGVA